MTHVDNSTGAVQKIQQYKYRQKRKKKWFRQF